MRSSFPGDGTGRLKKPAPGGRSRRPGPTGRIRWPQLNARIKVDILDMIHDRDDEVITEIRTKFEARVASEAPRERSISAATLDTCREVDAGLLVMGAYEHNRTFEQLFGGVTHDIIENAHLPVLLSH